MPLAYSSHFKTLFQLPWIPFPFPSILPSFEQVSPSNNLPTIIITSQNCLTALSHLDDESLACTYMTTIPLPQREPVVALPPFTVGTQVADLRRRGRGKREIRRSAQKLSCYFYGRDEWHLWSASRTWKRAYTCWSGARPWTPVFNPMRFKKIFHFSISSGQRKRGQQFRDLGAEPKKFFFSGYEAVIPAARSSLLSLSILCFLRYF